MYTNSGWEIFLIALVLEPNIPSDQYSKSPGAISYTFQHLSTSMRHFVFVVVDKNRHTLQDGLPSDVSIFSFLYK